DDFALGHLLVEEVGEGAGRSDDVALAVDCHERGGAWVEFHQYLVGGTGRDQAWARIECPMLSMSRAAVNGLDRKTWRMSTPASRIRAVFSRSSAGEPYRHQ